MKQFVQIIFFLLFLINQGNSLIAQYRKTDSTRIVYRVEKYPCPEENAVIEAAASPLPQYSFYSRLSAVSTTTDSAKITTSKTEYTYYFDDSSFYVALKKNSLNYAIDNIKQSVFIVEEIRDSIRFEVDLNQMNRKPKYANSRNCNRGINIYKIARVQEAKTYAKTGNTKILNGYQCDEYTLENENIKNSIWVAFSEDAWLNKSLVDLNNLETYPELLYFPPGMVMQYEIYNKKTKTMQKFEVTQIDKKHFYRISSDGYVLNLGF